MIDFSGYDLPLKIVQDGDLWSAVDAIGEVRIQGSSREILEENLPQIVQALQTAAAIRTQMARTGLIHRGDARWIV